MHIVNNKKKISGKFYYSYSKIFHSWINIAYYKEVLAGGRNSTNSQVKMSNFIIWKKKTLFTASIQSG